MPERKHRAAVIVDMHSRCVLVKQQFHRDCRPPGIRFDVLSVEKAIVFHDALYIRRKFSLTAGVSERRVMHKPSRWLWFELEAAHFQIFSKKGCALSHATRSSRSAGE